MIISLESLGSLERGIKQLLLEDRCSFSVEERALLNDCLALIELSGGNLAPGPDAKIAFAVNLVELLLKLLVAGDHIKHLF